jgi:hypothetical protein
MLVKIAARTQTQLLQERDRFLREFGPQSGQAPIVHRFPDGWSIRRLETQAHSCYEGELMQNCLGGASDLRDRMDPADWHKPLNYPFHYYSVRDPHNLPHGTFAHGFENEPTTNFWNLDLEGRHGANAGRYAPYVHDWWVNQMGGKPADPKTWEYNFGTPMTTVGSPEHEKEDADNFRPYHSTAWWHPDKEAYVKKDLPQLMRVVKFMRKQQRKLEEGAPWEAVEAETRARLSNNFKDAQVGYMVKDLKEEYDRWKQYQPYDDTDYNPPARIELPEFYWMHHTYGPDVMDAVDKAQRAYRGFHWNHPNFAANLLRNQLDDLGLDRDLSDQITDQFYQAHGQAWGQRQGVDWDREYGPASQKQLELRPDDKAWQEAQRLLKSFFPDLKGKERDEKLDIIYRGLQNSPRFSSERDNESSVKLSTFYHVAPADDREKVMRHGLDYNHRDRSRDWRDDDFDYENYPVGNYLTHDLERAREYAGLSHGDVYEVAHDGKGLTPDPDEQWDGTSFFSEHPIPATALTLREPHPSVPLTHNRVGGYVAKVDVTPPERKASVDPIGYCGEYAESLKLLHPDLRTGYHYLPRTADESSRVRHIFLHDDEYAYDAWGKHPFPYDAEHFDAVTGNSSEGHGWQTHLDASDPHAVASMGGWDLEGPADQYVQHIQEHGDPVVSPFERRASVDPGYYHGTSTTRQQAIRQEGLRGDERHGVFVTDDHDAARQYAKLVAHQDGSEPVVLGVHLPEMSYQPNGTPAPPFFHDDWHEQSGMPGNAWEYDGAVPPEHVVHPGDVTPFDKRASVDPPEFLYHHTPVENHESIMQHGLSLDHAGDSPHVFLTTQKKAGPGEASYLVDVRGLPIIPDPTLGESGARITG